MADYSKIEWTTHTWNPTTGCTQVSPGCDHCYALAIAEPKRGTPAFPQGFDITPYLHKQGNNQYPGRDRELEGRTWDQYPALKHPALEGL